MYSRRWFGNKLYEIPTNNIHANAIDKSAWIFYLYYIFYYYVYKSNFVLTFRLSVYMHRYFLYFIS